MSGRSWDSRVGAKKGSCRFRKLEERVASASKDPVNESESAINLPARSAATKTSRPVHERKPQTSLREAC